MTTEEEAFAQRLAKAIVDEQARRNQHVETDDERDERILRGLPSLWTQDSNFSKDATPSLLQITQDAEAVDTANELREGN